jgi:hypothetical protein
MRNLPPAGKVSFNLIKLISDTGLLLDVEKLLRQASQTGEPARHHWSLTNRKGLLVF